MMADGNQFIYEAQTRLGQTISGAIDAVSVDDAQGKLGVLGLVVTRLEAASAAQVRQMPAALSKDDFLLFNHQLAHLASAGLPMEQGLRLIAADVRSGRLAAAANDVAADLERGASIEQAFARQERRFPPLYARIVAAGVKAGNLPGLLLNIGQHMELVARLRQMLWRTLAYPAAVLTTLVLVVGLILTKILLEFKQIFLDFNTSLPLLTEGLLWVGDHAAGIGILLAVLVVLGILLIVLGTVTQEGRAAREQVTGAIPLVGPVLRTSLLARWCDALRLGVDAGMDLPQAIALAGEAVGSPRLQREGRSLGEWISTGRSLELYPSGGVIPATVPAAIDLGGKSGDLSRTLATLTRLFEAQAEHRLRVLPVVLTPLFTVVIAGIIGTVIVGTFLPLVKLIQSVSGEP